MVSANRAPGEELGGQNPGEHSDRTTLAQQAGEGNRERKPLHRRTWFRVTAAGGIVLAAASALYLSRSSGTGTGEHAAGGRATAAAGPNSGNSTGNTGGNTGGNANRNKTYSLRSGADSMPLDQIVGSGVLARAAVVDPSTLQCQSPVADPSVGFDFQCSGQSAGVINNFSADVVGGPSAANQPLSGFEPGSLDGFNAGFSPQLHSYSVQVPGVGDVNFSVSWQVDQTTDQIRHEDEQLAAAVIPALVTQG
jgi:hypothetical protein